MGIGSGSVTSELPRRDRIVCQTARIVRHIVTPVIRGVRRLLLSGMFRRVEPRHDPRDQQHARRDQSNLGDSSPVSSGNFARVAGLLSCEDARMYAAASVRKNLANKGPAKSTATEAITTNPATDFT